MNKNEKKFLENPGIDPGTSHMLSERSTIWANSPTDICRAGNCIYICCAASGSAKYPSFQTAWANNEIFTLQKEMYVWQLFMILLKVNNTALVFFLFFWLNYFLPYKKNMIPKVIQLHYHFIAWLIWLKILYSRIVTITFITQKLLRSSATRREILDQLDKEAADWGF